MQKIVSRISYLDVCPGNPGFLFSGGAPISIIRQYIEQQQTPGE